MRSSRVIGSFVSLPSPTVKCAGRRHVAPGSLGPFEPRAGAPWHGKTYATEAAEFAARRGRGRRADRDRPRRRLRTLSLDGLTDALAERGLRNRLGNPPGKSAIHQMLRNPIYAGVVRWKGVEREGIHPPLIGRALFDKVQTVLDTHSSGGERSWKHDHYLKGTLVCAECGSKLYYVVAKGRFGYFRCVGRNTGRTRCPQGRYIPAAALEREVELLHEGVRVPPALRRRLERVLRVEVAGQERHRAEATEFLGRHLRQLANEREKLLRASYGDAIDVATLKREQTRINAEVAEAESQLASDGEKLSQAKQIIDLALDLAKDGAAS